MKNRVFAIASIIFLLALFGCISKIDGRDMLNSTIDFDLSTFMNAQGQIGGDTPCTCLICTREEKSPWLRLFGLSDNTNDTLANAQCTFAKCNASTYQQTLADSDTKKGDWSLCNFLGQNKICSPRFFMIGSGTSSAEFSLAQQYCAGELAMPVIWASPQDNAPPAIPNPQTLMCHLAKSQMPVVVWYSKGKYINDPSYSAMLKSFNNKSANPQISGPIVVTTEALADPYYISSSGKKELNFTLLEQVKTQIETIKRDCPDCLAALALKPTFNSSGLPDFCPLDYYFAYRPQEYSVLEGGEDPLGCQEKYPSTSAYVSRPATGDFGTKIDLLGIGFNSNENENLTTCSPQKSIAQHLLYSKQALSNFYIPSVWYSVAISEGPTLTKSCTFSQDTVSKAYYDLMRGTSGFVASGVIGFAPYKLIDSPLGGPLECKAQKQLANPQINSLDEITPGSTMALESGQTIQVSQIDMKNSTHALFENSSGSTFLASAQSPSLITLSQLGCQYGVLNSAAQPKNSSQFSWFSSCQYYFTDRGPLFRTKLTNLKQVLPGDYIYSNDGIFSLFVEQINSTSDDEVIFFASSNQIVGRFSAKMDGGTVAISDMPLVPSGQQALMFSANGAGAQCTAFESSKMYFRSPPAQARPEGSSGVEAPKDKDALDKIAASQCGNCLSFTPMPNIFCGLKSQISAGSISFPKDACTQYPEMDAAFLQASIDPVLMRAIAVGESGLGRIRPGQSEPDIYGNYASACQISPAPKTNTACGPEIKPEKLADYESQYCAAGLLRSKAQAIDDAGMRTCAFGTFQCIKPPSPSYNPFEPKDSAECGAEEFQTKAGRYDDVLSQLRSDYSKNPGIDAFNPQQGGMSPAQFEWYAAWIAAYRYSGMGVVTVSLLENYSPDPNVQNDNVVKYLTRYLEDYCANLKKTNPNSLCYPEYGTAFILRYNEGINTCQNGCIYNPCTQSSNSQIS
ncbi:MAG: hypothetical protein V1822_03100 [Candidatus Micrarchaeota archaeon]